MRASFMNSTPQESFPTRLDIRTKLFISVLCSFSAMALTGILPLSILVCSSTLYALSSKNIKGILVTYGFIALLLTISSLFAMAIGSFFPELANLEAKRILGPFLRITLMVNVMIALALTSRIQAILVALKSLRLPGFLFIPTTVMIRFIPTFIDDIKQIRQTLKMRGYSISPLAFIRHPLRTIRLLFVPIVFRALRSADDLAIAAELKGVRSDRKMTSYDIPRLALRDYITMIITILLLSLAIWLQYKEGFHLGH